METIQNPTTPLPTRTGGSGAPSSAAHALLPARYRPTHRPRRAAARGTVGGALVIVTLIAALIAGQALGTLSSQTVSAPAAHPAHNLVTGATPSVPCGGTPAPC